MSIFSKIFLYKITALLTKLRKMPFILKQLENKLLWKKWADIIRPLFLQQIIFKFFEYSISQIHPNIYTPNKNRSKIIRAVFAIIIFSKGLLLF